jgi:hypothetical protein
MGLAIIPDGEKKLGEMPRVGCFARLEWYHASDVLGGTP